MKMNFKNLSQHFLLSSIFIIVFSFFLLTKMACAETWISKPYGPSITLRPSETKGAVEELFFDNTDADGNRRITYSLSLGGHQIEVELGELELDTIRVIPADGYIAIPDVLSIPDGETGIILIYPLESVGM